MTERVIAHVVAVEFTTEGLRIPLTPSKNDTFFPVGVALRIADDYASDGHGKMTKATIGLPKELKFAVPTGRRSAGAGARSVVAGHEIVHALMHHDHNTHLMAQTFYVVTGDDASGDKLTAKDVLMQPLQLSNATIGDLQAA
jgi:hypothetical protein